MNPPSSGAVMASASKPLPAIPTHGIGTTTLSVGARAHRSRLIRHILSQTQEPGVESRRDGWAYVLEEVLDDLGDAVARGEWFSGVKQRRALKRACLEKQAQAETKDDESKRKTTAEKSKDKKEGSATSTVIEAAEVVKSATATQSPVDILKDIRSLASNRVLSESTGSPPSYLVLCVAPHGSRTPLPAEDSGFDVVPANIGCSFSTGTYSLHVTDSDELTTTVLYGLREWEAATIDLKTTRLVGGTFVFKGVNSPLQHQALCKALRLCIYVQLSMVLEQHFLADSHFQLKFPRPKLNPPSPSTPNRHADIMPPHSAPNARDGDETKARQRHTLLPSSIFSFFSRKSHVPRSKTINPVVGRSGSLDLTALPSPKERSPRSSFDGGLRLRRFSLIGDKHPTRKNSRTKREPDTPFANAVKRLEESKGCLSTSPGVSFAPPKLLLDLAQKEGVKPTRRLKGDERASLSTILGWDGKAAQGKGMSGIHGFVRQQEISVLFGQHVPPATPPTPSLETEGSSAFTALSTSSNLPTPGFSSCGKPHWVTYRYYSHNTDEDQVLGEAIMDLTSKSQLPCSRQRCPYKRGQHELRLIHGGIRIIVRVDNEVTSPEIEDTSIRIWETCAVCSAASEKTTMTNATFLLSFAKFLELLLYSPMICTLTPALCEHTTPPPGSWSDLPQSRFNIMRHFSAAFGTVSFSLSAINDIFEFRVPRLQFTRDKSPPSTSISEHPPEDHDKKTLRREIRRWWEGVADHIDKLDQLLVGDDLNAFQKALPRLPSSDDAYESFEPMLAPLPPTTPDSPSHGGKLEMPLSNLAAPSLNIESSQSTPKQPVLPEVPSISSLTLGSETSQSTPKQPVVPLSSSLAIDSGSSQSTPKQSAVPVVPPKNDPSLLLASLRHNLHRSEQELYVQLSQTPTSSLNDVRRAFLAAAKGTQKRILAWQKKHLASKASLVGELSAEEPEWWAKGCHAVPGANIIIRERDWGSIIAFTLSTSDYHQELVNLSITRKESLPQTPPTDKTPSTSGPSSFFSTATGYRLFSSSSGVQPDPDQEDVIWHEPEPYSAVITRKEHTRDPTSILSFREVLRQKNHSAELPSPLLASRFATASNSTSQLLAGAPPSAWAKPDVAVSMQAADGEVAAVPEEIAEKLLQDLEEARSETSRPPSVIASDVDAHSLASSGFVDAHIRRGNASSVISVESDATIGKDVGSQSQGPSPVPPLPPPKDPPQRNGQKEASEATSSSAMPSTSSSFANTLASGLNVAMRFVMNNSSEPSRASTPSSSKKHHGLLFAEGASIDERPHIKYDWTIGKRLKFSCTVYYAKQFDVLRRRCGVNDLFLKSLSQSANWAAEGGKSKSNFWKTSDDRFIIKTLVNAWNVADLQVLIENGPSYFQYMESTAGKPTVLAKLIGFYTIEIRNLETGVVQSKADLLVMENLFYDQNISKTFDLKGIHGRKVKANTAQGHTSKTLFDGEWIEGQQHTLILVHPHSKNVLREAIKSDADFLARSNIMDYSLLLGVDDTKKEIACGLVDTVGSYTFAKTLEYKAKHGLQSGKEVTVVPPIEYQERFVTALEGYFLACPDKWSKPLDDSMVISDPDLLPSVL